LPGEAVALATRAIEEVKTALALCEAVIRHIESYPEFHATAAASSTAAAADGRGTPAPGAFGPGDSTPSRPLRRQVDPVLVHELRQAGQWVEPGKIVRIGRDRGGRVAWLADGSDTGGFTHLMDPDRVSEFERFGVAKDDIVDLVFDAAIKGEAIGISGRDRVVFLTTYGGREIRVAVSVGINGYVVGANPVSRKRKLKPLS
jgi:filamentous hemagglutinin